MSWQPEGFLAFRERFPATPELALPSPEPTTRFLEVWRRLGPDPIGAARALLRASGRPWTVVLVRGFLGNTMPGNFVRARGALRAAGAACWIADNAAGRTVRDNARGLAQQLGRRLRDPDAGLVLAGHSKGGLEALDALALSPELAARTQAVLLSQTPRGPSPVLESLLLGAHQGSLSRRRRWAEATQRLGLSLLGARAGGLELTEDALRAVIARLDSSPPPCRVIQTASWSIQPTTWLDSFHERLGEIRPGAAHDGQFFLEDLLWPGLEHVLLPRVDHAQPVMGGYGFDSARYWLAMLALVLPDAGGR